MKRPSLWNTISSNQMSRTNSALHIQVEPNPKNYEAKELDPSVFKFNEICSKCCGVLETISKPQIHGDVLLDVGSNYYSTALREVVVTKPKSPSKADDPSDSFFKSTRSVIILAQCFGLFPVIGITGSNHKSLKFKWLQWRMLYGLFGLVGLFLLFLCHFLDSAKSNFSYTSSHGVVFSGTQIVVGCIFIQIARNWPNINEDFAEMESNFNKYGGPPKISPKIKLITSVLMTFIGVQYVLGVYGNYKWIEPCFELGGSSFKTYMINILTLVFSRVPYSHVTALLTAYFDFLIYFTWIIRDLFLISISMNLSPRLKQLNGVMFQIYGQEMPPSFWRTIREDYNSLSSLVTEMDSNVQKLMLISIVDNVYRICIHILIKIKTVRAHIADLSFLFVMLGCLMLKTSFVLFSAASIHEESKKAKKILYSIPQNGYSAETKRFLTQLTTDEIALTGWGFFPVTRGLILTMAGTLITYEIIFVQFSKNLGFANEDLGTLKINKSDCVQF